MGDLTSAWNKTVDGLGQFLMIATNTAATTRATHSGAVDAVPHDLPRPSRRSAKETPPAPKGDDASVLTQKPPSKQDAK